MTKNIRMSILGVAALISLVAAILGIVGIAGKVVLKEYSLFDKVWKEAEGAIKSKRTALVAMSFVSLIVGLAGAGFAGFMAFKELKGTSSTMMFISIAAAVVVVAIICGILALVFQGQLNSVSWIAKAALGGVDDTDFELSFAY